MADEPAPKIIVDEDWKSQVQREKEALAAQQQATAPAQPETPPPAAAAPEAAASAAASAPHGPLPPASLTILITSLVAQASMVLEESLKREGNERNQFLDEARHIIDLLQVLEEKTKGNCTDDEAKLLGQALTEMRLAFVTVRDHPERFKAPPA
ncbi:MAG: DUF1844 domain-containing protein [Pirellulales bacterium]